MLHSETRCKWDIIRANYIFGKNKTITVDDPDDDDESEDEEDKEDKILKGRTGFRGCLYRDKIYFIFGSEMSDLKRKTKCLGDIVRFDPITNNIDKIEPKHKPERLLMPRKYYAGVLIHNYFFCHGGISWSETA